MHIAQPAFEGLNFHLYFLLYEIMVLVVGHQLQTVVWFYFAAHRLGGNKLSFLT